MAEFTLSGLDRTPQVHPSAFVAPSADVIGWVEVGPEASLWYQTVVRGDLERIDIGAGANVQDGTVVHADPGFPVSVGARATVRHRCVIHGCAIEADVLVGMGAVILNGCRIGAGSLLAAGCVLPEATTVPPGSLVMGVPGKVVRSVDAALTDRIRRGHEHYRIAARRYRAGRAEAGR